MFPFVILCDKPTYHIAVLKRLADVITTRYVGSKRSVASILYIVMHNLASYCNVVGIASVRDDTTTDRIRATNIELFYAYYPDDIVIAVQVEEYMQLLQMIEISIKKIP